MNKCNLVVYWATDVVTLSSYSSGLSVSPIIFWGLLLASLVMRLCSFRQPLEPSVDEAQYWLWGQTPQLGYYSKPPLIAWILAVTSFVDHLSLAQSLSLPIPAPIIHTLIAIFYGKLEDCYFQIMLGGLPGYYG